MTSVIRSKEQALSVLGLSSDASDTEIQATVRRLLQANHPDRPGGDMEVFHSVNAAKQFLQKTKLCQNCGGLKVTKIKQGRATVLVPCEVCNA